MAIARNAPCPCGSGRKHKLCCGTTREQKRAARRRSDALREAVGLATYFPLLRPDSAEFERWANELGDVVPTRELVENGLRVLSPSEQERIVATEAALHPGPWSSLCADIDDDSEAAGALLVGAVGAALGKRRGLDPDDLAAIEEDEMAPEEALCYVLEAGDLWSVVEAAIAQDTLEDAPERWAEGLGPLTAELWSPRHERRLSVLVSRVRAQLPARGRRRASRTLAKACKLCERDRAARGLVAAILLGEAAATLGLVDRAA